MAKTSILDNYGLAILVEEIRKYVQDEINEARDSVLEYDSSLLFPTVGKSNTIYIDMTSNKSYRWSEEDLKYYRLDFDDYMNIQIIDGCGRDEATNETKYHVLSDENGNYLTDESGNYLCLEV